MIHHVVNTYIVTGSSNARHAIRRMLEDIGHTDVLEQTLEKSEIADGLLYNRASGITFHARQLKLDPRAYEVQILFTA